MLKLSVKEEIKDPRFKALLEELEKNDQLIEQIQLLRQDFTHLKRTLNEISDYLKTIGDLFKQYDKWMFERFFGRPRKSLTEQKEEEE